MYTANGCYDPNITGTGVQPTGFDQMMQFYDHYTVAWSRVRVEIQNRGANAVCVGICLRDAPTTVTDYRELVANGALVWQMLQPAGTNGSIGKFTMSCNVKKFQGVQNVLDNSELRGDVASNPVEQSYYHICVWDPVTITAPSLLLLTTIEYDTWFTERKSTTISLTFPAAKVQAPTCLHGDEVKLAPVPLKSGFWS
jgi:hypothetical protein